MLSKIILIVLSMYTISAISEEIGDTMIVPSVGEPEYSFIDRNNINVASGALFYQFNDLSIGVGALSLNHGISISSNNLVNYDAYYQGYKDKYQGGIRRVRQQIPTYNGFGGFYFWEYIYVYDHESSYKFEIKSGGSFENLSDKRVTLDVVNSSTYLLTKADGTKIYYNSIDNIPTTITEEFNPHGIMQKIEYANGLEITIHKEVNASVSSPIKSVTTNSGLQLKYIYDKHSRPLAIDKQSANNVSQIPASSFNWSSTMPAKIIALNNAVETCPILGDSCSPTGEWPEVKYEWPDGMPAAMFIGLSEFSLTSASGVKTTFHHKAIDETAFYSGTDDEYLNCGFQPPNGQVCKPDEKYFPHVIKVSNSLGKDIEYKYDSTLGSYDRYKTIIKACQNNICEGYYVGNKALVTSPGSLPKPAYTRSGSNSYKGISNLFNSWEDQGDYEISVPYDVEMWDRRVYLNKDVANKVNKIENKLNGTTTEYFYDTSGRLNKKDSDGAITSILYPYSYTACDNYRYCNKPSSISNRYYLGLGETPIYTSYNYHPNSGQVASVTSPANSQNKIAKTVYSYQQYSARYLNAVGTLATSNRPIWLLSSKFSCQNSNVSGAGCSGNDKVETVYEYGSGSTANNLFILGKTITSQADGKSLTYCNKYDKYGNTIEESLPKSGITDCNIGRGY